MILISCVLNLILRAQVSPAIAASPKKCTELASELLTKSQKPLTQTDRLIGYLGELFENHTLTENELKRFLEALKKDQVSNPIDELDAETDLKLRIHRDGIEKIIRARDLDVKRLEEWTRKTLETRSTVHVRRGETQDQTQDSHQKIERVPVRPGSFQMGEKGKKIDVTLTHPFEVMATLVTQNQWVKIMGENPSKHQEGSYTTAVGIAGKVIRMQPDHPVEQVTWWSAVAFANKLSEKYGLKPAYDLSKLVFKPKTSAALGNLDAVGGSFSINSPSGSIYETEGFRLPTEAEQEYLMRAAGKGEGRFYFGDDLGDLANYAWYNENANQSTHPVAQLKPLIIDGKEIYDLHGNVWEWANDFFDNDLGNGEPKSVVDPTGPETGSDHAMRGGSFSGGFNFLTATNRRESYPGDHYPNVGFRLVRTKR